MQLYANVYLMIQQAELPVTHEHTPHAAIFDASERAFATLVEQGHPADQVHRLSLCYDAAALMVDDLTGGGYAVVHEMYASPEAGEHSYVSTQSTAGEEVIADPTWQQFLKESRPKDVSLPRVLIGTREEVVRRAAGFGVSDEALAFWRGTLQRRDPIEQRRINQEAAAAADKAADAGLWEQFMAARH